MSREPSQPLAPSRWLGVPALLSVCATILLAIPFHVLGFGLPEPLFPIALAFAWGMIRPSFLAPILLFALGLFQDFYWSGPLGLWPVAFLIAYATAIFGRSLVIGQGGVVTAGWYGVSVLLALASAFGLTTLKAHTTPGLIATAWQFAWTFALFPLAYRLIDRFEDADVRFR